MSGREETGLDETMENSICHLFLPDSSRRLVLKKFLEFLGMAALKQCLFFGYQVFAKEFGERLIKSLHAIFGR